MHTNVYEKTEAESFRERKEWRDKARAQQAERERNKLKKKKQRKEKQNPSSGLKINNS